FPVTLPEQHVDIVGRHTEFDRIRALLGEPNTRLVTLVGPGGVGKTWKDGDFEQLLGDVTSRVFDVFADDTVVYPGHGDDTTLGAERPHLGEWRERGW
ncbi:MAG: MBL fold metallo-hydrolase, partial [Mycobacterium sp.]|nr:MBL fold metallo-hydrolase [Mycobacterium sp.]